ncbi:MAG: hypothetical protein ABSE49_00885 [Polyangiaceae bacterium]|jgi:hypothetical protein
MKAMVALLGSLSLVPMMAGSAMAQSAEQPEENVRVEPPAVQAQPVPPPPQYTAPQYAPPPAQVAVQSGGEWQYLDGEGWVWVPAGTTAYNVGAQPYVYLYTPSYGWTWYMSPWGWGPYYRGGWIHAPYWGRGVAWGHYYGGHVMYGHGYGGHYGGGYHGGGYHGGGGHGGGGHGGHR